MSDPLTAPIEGDRADDERDVPPCPACGLRWCDCGGWGDYDLALAREAATEAFWAVR